MSNDRWGHLDDGSDPQGRAAAEKYVESITPAASAGADPEPHTEAGRRLLEMADEKTGFGAGAFKAEMRRAILAIEAEARAQGGPSLDEERLAESIAEAMNHVPWPGERGSIRFGGLTYGAAARAIAAAYARLGVAPEAPE